MYGRLREWIMGFRPQAERATLHTAGRTSDLTQRATLQKPSPYGRLREWVMSFRPKAEDDVAGGVPLTYKSTSLIRNTPLLGPYRRTIPRVIWWC